MYVINIWGKQNSDDDQPISNIKHKFQALNRKGRIEFSM